MFSYRHAFHAGSHADVLKHMALIAVLRHLLQKEGALTVVDTHAGAGLYRLDGDYAVKGGEAVDGVVKLFAAQKAAQIHAGKANSATKIIANSANSEAPSALNAPLISDYLDLVTGFNRAGALRVYPGSPFVVQQLLRTDVHDKLKLYELHPTDAKVLAANIAQLEAGRQVTVTREDGFASLRGLIPPPPSANGSRRALVLMDPSYELKNDYERVRVAIQETLKRFPTGNYMVWYPVIPRPEAHDLPRRLKTLAQQAGKPWLHATLHIGQRPASAAVQIPGEPKPRPGLSASGIFLINPPHTLKQQLGEALPQLLAVLGRGRGQSFAVEAG